MRLRRPRAVTGEALERELAGRDRPTSFPFISGDTFRAMSDVVVDEGGVSRLNWRRGDLVFVATKYVGQLLELASAQGRADVSTTMSVVVHNGDTLPGKQDFESLLSRFARVWTVNATDELLALGVRALPIGLENLHWNRNGLLEYFCLPGSTESLPALADRPSLILGSFRSVTNPEEREPLQRELLARGATWHDPSGSVGSYVEALRRSVFVVSPRGNGLDCHRTWEALYLGAVPVVTKGSLAPELVSGLPILEVSDWNSFLSQSDDELRALAVTLAEVSCEKAYMPYWCAELARERS